MSQYRLSSIPIKPWRPLQIQVLDEIQQAMNDGFYDIILEAPTGFGKTPVAVALGRALGTSYIISATKDLQEQYRRDFPFIQAVMGRNNFDCNEIIRLGRAKSGDPTSWTADKAPCLDKREYPCNFKPFSEAYALENPNTEVEKVVYNIEEIPNKLYQNVWHGDGDRCRYFHQKYRGYKASHTIFNYPVYLRYALYSIDLDHRELTVYDEAHTIPDQLTQLLSVSVTEKRLKDFFPPHELSIPQNLGYDTQAWFNYALSVARFLEAWTFEVKRIEAYMLRHPFPPSSSVRRREVGAFNISVREWEGEYQSEQEYIEFMEDKRRDWSRRNRDTGSKYSDDNIRAAENFDRQLHNMLMDYVRDPNTWVVGSVITNEFGRVVKVEYKPLDVSKYMEKIMKLSRYHLFLSATILGKVQYCSMLGLDPEKVKFISVRSEFPIENRPIYCPKLGRLSKATEAELMPRFIQAIDVIMSKYPDKKGIIHTSSYHQSQLIEQGLSQVNVRRLLKTDPKAFERGIRNDRQATVREHAQTDKPTVLLSPSMRTGLDLKDEMSRFQIIVKVPYPNLGDRMVIQRKERNPHWYQWTTALEIVQAYGRSVRSPEDHADTWILDTTFNEFFWNQTHHILPEWFKEAVITDPQNPHIREILNKLAELNRPA